MNIRHASLPLPISLGSPPLRRVSQQASDLLHAVLEHLRRAARRRAERRVARSYQALYASLDARTLRDIGLGEWVGPTLEDEAQLWRRGIYR